MTKTKQELIEKIIISDLSSDFIADLWFRIKKHQNPTRSQCPNCKGTHLRKFSSLDKKVCDDCLEVIEWKLKDKEKPII